MEALERPGEDVLDRREDAEKADHRNSRWSSALSTPPWLQGLQRSSRQPARIVPRTSPYRRRASMAYCEQDGWYLHVAGNERAQRVAVGVDACDPDVPHARALPRTSSRRSRIHSAPRPSSASPRGARTSKT